MNELAAIILAAGKGSRIGQPKWSLSLNGGTFLSTIVDNLLAANIDNIGCVVSKDSVPSEPRVTTIFNPEPEKGMLSSLFYGIETLANYAGYLVMPVDHPHVQTSTIAALAASFRQNPEKVIQPLFLGKPGHPIIIPQTLATEINPSNIDLGLRGFLARLTVSRCGVVVEDKGVKQNINWPRDM